MDKVLYINPQSSYYDNRRRKKAEDSSLGTEERKETRGSESPGMDTGSQGYIRTDRVGSGGVSGSPNSTEQREGKRPLKMVVEAMWGVPLKGSSYVMYNKSIESTSSPSLLQ